MKKYTSNEVAELRQSYIDAGVDLVAKGGWAALTLRNVGKSVGKSFTAIQRQFPADTLTVEVANEAYHWLISAFPTIKSEGSLPTTEIRRAIVAFFKRMPLAAALVVQVAALKASTDNLGSKTVAAAIDQRRRITITLFTANFQTMYPAEMKQVSELRAKRLVVWAFGACITLVMKPETSTDYLVNLFPE